MGKLTFEQKLDIESSMQEYDLFDGRFQMLSDTNTSLEPRIDSYDIAGYASYYKISPITALAIFGGLKARQAKTPLHALRIIYKTVR